MFFDVENGLRRSDRTGLNKMLRKAAKGKIDYIITKSISRVSRDTLEILKIIRFLRERGINMHFENENLDSIRLDKEFEITLRSMLAQDESRNTSENIQWGFQRKFEKGDIFTKYKNFMGYTCVDGEIVIVPEQAEVVRKIFDLYLQGLSFGQIKSYLESQGIKTEHMGTMLLISDIYASFTEIFVSLEADYRSSYLLERGICPQEYIRLTRFRPSVLKIIS